MAVSPSVHTVPAREKAATKSLRPRVPTSVIATLLGVALTVWLAPAFTHQWEDRQAARDLQARLAEQMVVSAFQTIRDGARLAHGQGQYDVILGQWKEAGLTTQVRAKAYFDQPIVREWDEAVHDVEYFLLVCDLIADAREESSTFVQATVLPSTRTNKSWRSWRSTHPRRIGRSDCARPGERLARCARERVGDLEERPFAKVSAAADELLSALQAASAPRVATSRTTCSRRLKRQIRVIAVAAAGRLSDSPPRKPALLQR